MAGFIQIIEYQTSRPEEIEALGNEFRQRREGGDGTPPRSITVTQDRDRPGYYLNIVEFESYEAAMENSKRQDTSDFAAKMAQLCDGQPTFYNLDVVQSWQPDLSR